MTTQPPSVAFLIPIDMTRHARFALELAALKSPHSDVYAVLSRGADLDAWNKINSPCTTLVLSDWVSEEAIQEAEKRGSMPTFKKWCALTQLTDKSYRFIITCDSEIHVLKPIDEAFVAALPSQFVFFGDHLSSHPSYDVYRKLLRDCQSRVPSHSQSACANSIYTWWSGLPVYECGDSLTVFLTSVRAYKPLDLAQSLNREIFDHIVYQHYAVSCSIANAKFVCSTHDCQVPFGWSLEDTAPEAAFAAAQKSGLAILWASRDTRRRLPDKLAKVYIEYHLDHPT